MSVDVSRVACVAGARCTEALPVLLSHLELHVINSITSAITNSITVLVLIVFIVLVFVVNYTLTRLW